MVRSCLAGRDSLLDESVTVDGSPRRLLPVPGQQPRKRNPTTFSRDKQRDASIFAAWHINILRASLGHF